MSETVADPFRIIWEKWKDPFTVAVKEHRERGWFDSYEYLEKPGQMGAYQGPVIMGPMGIVPLNELNCPSKNFNIWVGHTSFVLGKSVVRAMRKVDGVEIFRPWTPYRFWVGIARTKDEDRVKQGIFQAARKTLVKTQPVKPSPEQQSAAQLTALQNTLRSQYPYWAIFFYPNGKMDVATGDSQQAVELHVKGRTLANKVITSWENQK